MNFVVDFKHLNDEHHVYKEISILDLKDVFYNNETAFIIIGGPWCPKTQAIMGITNTIAKREGLNKIFVYNPRFINVFGEEEDLRDCLTLEHKLDYYFIVEKIGFKNEHSELVQDTLIQKMDTPVFVVVKEGKALAYYSSKFILNPYLRYEDNLEDKTLEFDKELTKLIKLLK